MVAVPRVPSAAALQRLKMNGSCTAASTPCGRQGLSRACWGRPCRAAGPLCPGLCPQRHRHKAQRLPLGRQPPRLRRPRRKPPRRHPLCKQQQQQQLQQQQQPLADPQARPVARWSRPRATLLALAFGEARAPSLGRPPSQSTASGSSLRLRMQLGCFFSEAQWSPWLPSS